MTKVVFLKVVSRVREVDPVFLACVQTSGTWGTFGNKKPRNLPVPCRGMLSTLTGKNRKE